MSQETIPPARWVRVLNALTANQAVPSLTTDGIRVPTNWKGKFILARLKTAATGARTATITLYGYKGLSVDDDGAAVASSNGWINTGESWSISGSTNYDQIPSSSGLLQALTAFERLGVQVASLTGTAHAVTLDLGFTE